MTSPVQQNEQHHESIDDVINKKDAYLDIALEHDLRSPGITTGFEKYRLVHNALPEINIEDVDTSIELFGKRLSAPIIIAPMLGGTERTAKLNENLARAAQETGCGMVVGSQRVMVEHGVTTGFLLRDVAPDILLFSCLGAQQINRYFSVDECLTCVKKTQADGLVLFLNPLHEALSEGGDADFSDVLKNIGQVCRLADFPVVVKEVGFGISGEVAKRLAAIGVAGIDVAGAGGTSFALMEYHRARDASAKALASTFAAHGIPTSDALEGVVAAVGDLPVIASGGVRDGIDIAKALALGARAVGVAGALMGPSQLPPANAADTLRNLTEGFRIAMHVTATPTNSAISFRMVDRGEVDGRNVP